MLFICCFHNRNRKLWTPDFGQGLGHCRATGLSGIDLDHSRSIRNFQDQCGRANSNGLLSTAHMQRQIRRKPRCFPKYFYECNHFTSGEESNAGMWKIDLENIDFFRRFALGFPTRVSGTVKMQNPTVITWFRSRSETPSRDRSIQSHTTNSDRFFRHPKDATSRPTGAGI